MKQIQTCLLSLVIFTSVVATSLFPYDAVAETCEQWVAQLVSIQGDVEARRVDETKWQPVKFKDTFCPGDMIRVLERSRADILLSNGAILRLDQNTAVAFNGVEKEQTSLIDLVRGVTHFFSRFPRSLKVFTPFVNGTVEGTEFLVRVESHHTFLSVFEGQVAVANETGSLTLTSGQSAVAEAGKAPVLRAVVRPRDAVQWALYYPSVIYYRPDEFQVGALEDWQTMVRNSLEFYWKGDVSRAFASIEKAPEDIRDPRFFIYRAYLFLSVGRIDEAKADIERVLNLDPVNSNAFVLQSIIAVVQNEKDKALSLARKAVEADPQSATAMIALGYAQQASFDLKEALASTQEAVKLDPKNALAWARLSEMWLSFGNLDEALNAANKAVALNPNLTRTQTVLGFAYLTQVKTKLSKDVFEKAIELDQADPLPRLGLGLAKIREGNLQEGRKEIEIAVSLDPDNSLIRSYLGKAYYEEKRDSKAEEQFIMAKELNPLDPTPFFYDAIQKQTLNRPVEALHDMQQAIELNDNRAIYRSRLLLDSDLAARSASLGRIYTDLGFQQLALVEGWKSVNTDPADFSSHRFLADSYSALPRHEIARVSELLQSQLLQPINITPVQPHLAESNLFILDGAGPADLSFNEFNPLFNRNRLALQLSGIAGGENTFGDEVVFSGVQGKASFSVGQFHYETDGFRENNDQRQDIYNAFVQYSLSPKTSVQAEFRYTDTEKGDLPLRFNPDDFNPDLRQKQEIGSMRLGFHHAFTPYSDIIASFIYGDANFDSHIFTGFDYITDEDGYMAEVQHLFRSERFHVTSGIGHFNVDRKDVSTFSPFPPMVEKADIRHTNLYTYSMIDYPKNVTWTLGGSADFFEGGIVDRNQFNPKLGLTWNPLPTTTLRSAVFRVFKRMLISNQTIEPTQVAGFNQFFDDTEGTDAWCYGIGIDQKFSKDLYGGAEISRRDLKVPYISLSTQETLKTDWEEEFGRAYLYWTANRRLTLSAEYEYERFKREPEAAGEENVVEVKTHRVPLGISYFHPLGVGARLKVTYINQKGEFGNSLYGVVPGSDQFWVVDASISYRLPKRFGLIIVGAKNLFDKSFKYQDMDPVSPTIQPERLIFAKFTLAF